ncbi:MAG: hypothetical protein ACJAUG_000876 [Halioglobus sp.]|jgi:hypothetical protein
MKLNHSMAVSILCSAIAVTAQAESSRDCRLEGTVLKGDNDEVRVKIHRVEKYSNDSACRIRRDRKLKFKLPDDPRLRELAPGSEVQYRYRTDEAGDSKTELVKIST